MINLAWNYYAEAIAFTDYDELSADYIDFSTEFVTKQQVQIAEFLDNPEVKRAVEVHTLRKVVHDFWYTRNGHGAGFWDGDYENGEVLTDIADSFGEVSTYEGDDLLLYS